MSLNVDAIKRRVDWLRDNEEQCRRSPGQVSMAGYAAAAIDCGRDVPLLLEEFEALQSRAERYRLAWTNARERAAALAEALVEADDERDALRAELARRP